MSSFYFIFYKMKKTDIPFSFAYIIPMVRYGSSITPEQTRVPKKVFAVMGALDALSGIMQIFASTYLGGSLLILLAQVTTVGAIWGISPPKTFPLRLCG